MTFSVLPGRLDAAAALWRDELLRVGSSEPGFVRAMLWRDDSASTMVGIGFWETKADANRWTETGPWRPGSPVRERFTALLAADRFATSTGRPIPDGARAGAGGFSRRPFLAE